MDGLPWHACHLEFLQTNPNCKFVFIILKSFFYCRLFRLANSLIDTNTFVLLAARNGRKKCRNNKKETTNTSKPILLTALTLLALAAFLFSISAGNYFPLEHLNPSCTGFCLTSRLPFQFWHWMDRLKSDNFFFFWFFFFLIQPPLNTG